VHARKIRTILVNRDRVLGLVAHDVFSVTHFRQTSRMLLADAGGLLSYTPNIKATFRQCAGYVDKILKGAEPSDPPIQQPTKNDLIVNLKIAKALGITIPPSILARADEVIE
jgi:ABC-type uncharacterized transport system substrate-binding protein